MEPVDPPFRFGEFVLDPSERRLARHGQAVDLSGRYLDALILLAGRPGQLITKDQFLEAVWHGVPVTDEALTQCIRSLRRALDDDAAAPRFIQTVPRHGYRFVTPVERGPAPLAPPGPDQQPARSLTLPIAIAGTIGGGFAGLIGGLLYGFVAASALPEGGPGAASVVLVLLTIAVTIAVIGAAGVSGGIAVAERLAPASPRWRIVGGAGGGLLIGAVVKLVAMDAFRLLLGRAPGDVTGALEGLVLGGAVGLGAALGAGHGVRRAAVIAGGAGAVAGAALAAMGRPLLAGSLALLTRAFPDGTLRLGDAGALVGQPTILIVCGALEGGLFAACLVAATTLARRHLAER